MSETGTKIGIVGLGVIAVIVAALYFIYSRGWSAVSAAINPSGIMKEDAISTNAARDSSDPAVVSTTGTDENSKTYATLNSSAIPPGSYLNSTTGTVSTVSNIYRGNGAASGSQLIQSGNSSLITNPVNITAMDALLAIIHNQGYSDLNAYNNRLNPSAIQEGADLRTVDKNALFQYFAIGGVNTVTAVGADTVAVKFYHPYDYDANDQQVLSANYFPAPVGFKEVSFTQPTPATGMYQIVTLRRV